MEKYIIPIQIYMCVSLRIGIVPKKNMKIKKL